jgi:hypothetical protein
MTVVFLYVMGKSQALLEGPGKSYKVVGALLFPMIALLISVSRVVDYEHHPADITAGVCDDQVHVSVFRVSFFFVVSVSAPLLLLSEWGVIAYKCTRERGGAPLERSCIPLRSHFSGCDLIVLWRVVRSPVW